MFYISAVLWCCVLQYFLAGFSLVFPAGTRYRIDVELASMRRGAVASTSVRRIQPAGSKHGNK